MGCNDPGPNYVPVPGLDKLIDAIKSSWSAETSQHYLGAWTKEKPSAGQCCVTSLLIQEYFGGKIARGEVVDNDDKIVHYWNVLPFGEMDVTFDQFDDPKPLWFVVDPDKDLYWFQETKDKLDLLRRRVHDRLERHAIEPNIGH